MDVLIYFLEGRELAEEKSSVATVSHHYLSQLMKRETEGTSKLMVLVFHEACISRCAISRVTQFVITFGRGNGKTHFGLSPLPRC